ncbi:hypothetical protein AUK04_04350 [Candidatus Roizmanbacteria bacterium CG2_30_33_16]|uniref:Uncharacterized protein n=3 Tax=Candidatus Roizmaniibacteriota TaxID=1752723 RepID=A0A2M8DBF8_9BACT|nr:hypothetical protein [Candidatus Roizmanbacteria bacterium]OIP82637.1 MAG: hypothetical protein AUK04_04350 [Candidatus Roizmanbacteria bacterium CG2_30_33_16]PJB87743.1 MAG: hypothetical protein CO083_05410 [Candidatus Roizmanbacteria bacterium CG_4_9_14_0_8_um_filter_34_12]
MPNTETKIAQPKIVLSKYTAALLSGLQSVKKKVKPDDFSKIIVSQTVSFFALVYERIRNAVEYREDHLIRRAAIERIIKRRLMLHPEGIGEAENLLRELLWARYFPNGGLGGHDIQTIQKIIDNYLSIKKQVTAGRLSQEVYFLTDFVIDMLTCEIEETLSPEDTSSVTSLTYYIYQVLRKKVKIEGLTEEQRDAYFLTALERAYRRSDRSYQRYHLFAMFYQPIGQQNPEQLKTLSTTLPKIFKKVDEMVKSLYVDKLTLFIKKQLPPFLILFSLLKNKISKAQTILSDKNLLWNEVDLICREKYQQLNQRVRNLAIRSFIYIFLTKMLFALILEFPASRFFYNEVNTTSIIINTLFPPILMLTIVSIFRMPNEDNTKKIYQRIIGIIDADATFETTIAFMPKKAREKKPFLVFGFTIFYSLTFIVTLFLIYQLLKYLQFNFISMLIFIFFVSVVTFFSYRIKQIVNEYRLEEKGSIFSPFIDFFFMPILSLGKFFSSEIAKLNFFIFIFDFLIEAPFKLVFEVVEEWISFVKKRKEEII